MEGILSNGNKGVGMMAPIDLLVEQVKFASAHLEDSNALALHRALGASQSSNADMWRIVLRMIDEGVASIDACTEAGDTMLHLLARGTDGISGVDASKQLLARGAKPDMINKLDERPLDLAVGQGSAQLCRVLLERGSDIFKCRAFNNNNNEMTSLYPRLTQGHALPTARVPSSHRGVCHVRATCLIRQVWTSCRQMFAVFSTAIM